MAAAATAKTRMFGCWSSLRRCTPHHDRRPAGSRRSRAGPRLLVSAPSMSSPSAATPKASVCERASAVREPAPGLQGAAPHQHAPDGGDGVGDDHRHRPGSRGQLDTAPEYRARRGRCARIRAVSTLSAGDTAPDFTLSDDRAHPVTPSRPARAQGRPRTSIPGTTRRAARSRPAPCAIAGTTSPTRAPWSTASRPTPSHSHVKFRAKYGLQFPLLADTEHAVAEAYGTWVEKSTCTARSTGHRALEFLVGEDGTLERVWRRVKPDAHTELVLEALQG